MSVKVKKALLTVLGVATAALTGCSLLPVEEPALKPPLVEPAQEKLNLYEVKRADITDEVSGVATFESAKMDYLYFVVSGARLVSIEVTPGDRVKAGQVVATTDNGELEMKIRLQEISVEKTKISLKQAMAEKDDNDPDIQIKKLDLESQLLQLQSQREQYAQSKLVATIDGIVTNVDTNLKPGDKVNAYDRLVTITDPSEMNLVYTGSQEDLTGIAISMDVSVTYRDETYSGKVVQTPLTAPPNANQAIEKRNATSIVIDVEGLPADVGLGDHAEISIIKKRSPNALVIPRGGLRTYMGRSYVQVLDGESRKEIDVEPGIKTKTEVEIRKGLQEGQQVILN
ncbi:efflux RND transporter periplasmic adaptor subunit [Paenibacillus tarimensis]